MSITWANVVDHAPELSAVDADAQGDILGYVNDALVADLFGGEDSGYLKLARIYLAAHYGTVARSGGTGLAGPVTSESAGGLSRSYGLLIASGGADPLLDTTAYGRAFRSLLRRSPARSPVAL